MRTIKTLLLLLLVAGISAPLVWYVTAELRTGSPKTEREFGEDEPDLPPGSNVSKEDYLKARIEQMDMLRGFDTAKQDSRAKAINAMEESERALARSLEFAQAGSWTPLGPAPIPVNAGTSYSGRVSAIAVHPTNPNTVYVGTAQGGLYRSLNGGTTWTPLMDSAMSLAIGAVAISPSDPTTVYVGTGESTLCGSGCFIGVGVYRITNADTTPVLSGPLNKNAANADIFTGRAISEVVVHPTDPNTIFVSTTSGIAGIGSGTTGLTVPTRGVYRSTNAMSASPTFQLLSVAGISERSVTDIAIVPGDASKLYVGVLGVSAVDGGVYYSANALDPVPTFTQLLSTSLTGSGSRVELAANKVGATTTVYAASGQATGTLYKSVDGGAFVQTINNNFCNPQCFYDIAVAVDPNDANIVYLGGSPTMVFGRSTNGGTSFINSSANLHVDTQAIAVAPSSPNTIYFGSDGGIWKTLDPTVGGVVWTTLNNSTFSATQFMGLSLHPTDRHYMIGGTQDNGTQYLAPSGTLWVRSDGGDGGFAVIDKNAVDTSNVTAYHTYYNSSGSQIGFNRATTTDVNGDPNWVGFYGCGGTANGINCADAVLFYAPMVGGPNAPDSSGTNTLYFGTTRLYRSANRGTTMTDVSGVLPARISAIGIAPQNDDVRLVGTTAGSVYLSTTAGATTMTNVTGTIPARYIGRIAIDPTNSNVAYVVLNGFGLAAGQHVYKTVNLLSGTPTWVPAGSGIPDTPVNALAIDPANTQVVYAGTDIGVFKTADGGATWIPFSTGLPRVAVFGMEIQPVHRILKIATHGRGIWEYNLNAATPRAPFDFDGDNKTDLSIFRPAPGEWWYSKSTNGGNSAVTFGTSTDTLTPADFTGDGKTDVAFFRPSTGLWYVLRSEDLTFYAFPFGTTGDVTVPADYDGDGKADAAIFRPSTNTWYISRSTGGTTITGFGAAGDLPVPADYDGDGKADVSIFRPSVGQWWLQRSTAGLVAFQFGQNGDRTVPGDFTGDGKADVAFFRPATGTWTVLRSEDFSFYAFPFGTTGDVPSPGDYDGDGKADAAVFRPSTSTWYANRSTAGTLIQQFGQTGDLPVPNSYVR